MEYTAPPMLSALLSLAVIFDNFKLDLTEVIAPPNISA